MYLAIMSYSPDGTVTKFQECADQAAADAHVAAFIDVYPDAFAAALPAFEQRLWLVSGGTLIKNTALETTLAAEQATAIILSNIRTLENTITPRRLREAMLGNVEAIAFIQGVEDDIDIEREKL